MRIKVSLVAVAVMALACIGSAQGGQGGQGGRQGRGMGMMGAQRLTQLLRNTQVQEELKVTDEEKTKIEALPGGRGPGGPGGGGNGGGQGGGGQAGGGGQRRGGFGQPMTPEAMAKQLAEDKATTSAILTPEQEKRLEELRIQWAGPMAVLLPDVQTGIGLSADQKAKITDLQTKMNDANRIVRDKMQSGETDRQEGMQTMMANATTMRTELDKVLTDDQKAKLKAMGGAELKMEMPQRRPGGGGGAPPQA